MSPRGRFALGILAVWTLTLGWHAKRLYFRPIQELVAEASRTIPPGTAYYRVYQGEEHVGWATSEIDTLPAASGFLLRDRLEATLRALDQEVPTSVESEAELAPTLALRRFSVTASGAIGYITARGEVHGDSEVAVTVAGAIESDTLRLPVDGPVILAGAWPMRFVAQGQLEPGDRYSLPVFDPVTARRRDMELEVLATDTRTFPDSVDIEDGLWVVAHEDTVRAWLVRLELGGMELRSWVDEDGRFLETETAAGFRLERTAFEMAFYGDSVRTVEAGGQR
jgi:hypothetical protein